MGINILDELYKNEALWLVLGCLVSADSLVSIEECEKSKDIIKEFKTALLTTELLPEEAKKSISDFLEKAEDIIEKEKILLGSGQGLNNRNNSLKVLINQSRRKRGELV